MIQETESMSQGSKNNYVFLEQARLLRRKQYLHIRFRIINAIRSYFVENGYLEVETPQIISCPPPEANIDPMPVGKRYLHTSPELCMKRLLAAGYQKIFQITKCFREGERGNLHLPELTLLEWYSTGIDYKDLMEETEALFLAVSRELGRGEKLTYNGRDFDIMPPWKRISVKEAFAHYSPVTLEYSLSEGIFDEVLTEEVEVKLSDEGPIFLYDYPASFASFARLKPEDNNFSERFEMYFAGIELANGFSELNDPQEQKERFIIARDQRKKMGKPVYPFPEKFLDALKFMPEAAGIALGVDRLAMVFADRQVIDDVVTFTPEEL